MSSSLLKTLERIETGRQTCITKANKKGIAMSKDADFSAIAQAFDFIDPPEELRDPNVLSPISYYENWEDDPEIWKKPQEWAIVDEILKNAQDEDEFIPMYLLLLEDSMEILQIIAGTAVDVDEQTLYLGITSRNNEYKVKTSDEAEYILNSNNISYQHTWAENVSQKWVLVYHKKNTYYTNSYRSSTSYAAAPRYALLPVKYIVIKTPFLASISTSSTDITTYKSWNVFGAMSMEAIHLIKANTPLGEEICSSIYTMYSYMGNMYYPNLKRIDIDEDVNYWIDPEATNGTRIMITASYAYELNSIFAPNRPYLSCSGNARNLVAAKGAGVGIVPTSSWQNTTPRYPSSYTSLKYIASDGDPSLITLGKVRNKPRLKPINMNHITDWSGRSFEKLFAPCRVLTFEGLVVPAIKTGSTSDVIGYTNCKILNFPNLTIIPANTTLNPTGLLEELYMDAVEEYKNGTHTYFLYINDAQNILKIISLKSLKTLETYRVDLSQACHLEEIYLNSLSKCTTTTAFNKSSLRKLVLGNNFESPLTLSSCTHLDKECFIDLFEKLIPLTEEQIAEGTYIITIGKPILYKFTEEELDIARNKGWIIN